jgi:hypothetical protein
MYVPAYYSEVIELYYHKGCMLLNIENVIKVMGYLNVFW